MTSKIDTVFPWEIIFFGCFRAFPQFCFYNSMYVFQTISVYVKRKHKLISNLWLRNELVISWVKLRWKGLKMPLSAVLKGDNLRLSFLKHIETPVKDYKACGNGLPHWFSVLSDCTCSKPSWKENLLLHAKIHC